MKKIFKSLAAIALVAFAASCTNELLENPASYDGEEAVVNFSVATPGLMTRAVADGNTVDKVQCHVYDKDGNLIEGVGKTSDMSGGKADISLRLVTGQTYSFVFWAYDKDGNHYELDSAAKSVTVNNYTTATNDESRDAFYAYVANKTITGSLKEPVTLNRPFAQLNFGVDKADVEAATALGVTVSKSSLTLTKLANTLNLATGEVSGEVDAAFTAAELLSEKLKVNNTEYGYVSMNYVLVGKAAKAMTEAKLTIYDASNAAINTISLPNVPLQGNYRTNIIGKLYTSQADFNIVVDPAFTETINVDRLSIPAGYLGTYNLPDTKDDILLNIEGDCKGENVITIAYNENAATSQNYPANVTINAGSYNISNLVVNLENSHVDIEGGTFETVSSQTNNSTLVLSNSTIITGKLEVAKGGVEIACEVAEVEVKETVPAEAKIVLAPTANITTSMTTTSSAPIIVKATASDEGQVKEQAKVSSIVVKAPETTGTTTVEYKAPVIELQNGASLAEDAIIGEKANEVVKIESETATSESGEELEAFIKVKDIKTLEYALENGREVKLAAGITGNFNIASGTNTIIDLNGQTLSTESGNVITIESGASLTLKDGSGNGKIQSASNAYTVDNTNGTLIVEGISLANVLSADGVRSYVADEKALNAAIADTNIGKIVISADIDLTKTAVINGGRKVVIDMNGKTITKNDTPFDIYNATVDFIGTGIIAESVDDGHGLMLRGSGTENVANYTVVTIGNGITLKGWAGIFVAKDDNGTYNNYGLVVNCSAKYVHDENFIKDVYGVYINGSNQQTGANAPIFNLDGADFDSRGVGIYAAGYAVWNIKNSKVVGRMTAIEIRAGIMNISSGEFTSTANPFTVQPNGSGTTTDGAAIGISQHNTNLPINVTISGGTFNGVYAIWEKDVQNDVARDQIKLTVTGGVFNGAIYSQNNPRFIYSGTFLDASANQYKYDWDGSVSEPTTDANGNYLITKASELAWIAKEVNEGITTFKGKTVYLNADINLCNLNWAPIGLYGEDAKSFQGTFDGKGYTISNLYVHSAEQKAYLGLFGRVLNGSLKNFTVENADIASEVSICSGSACGVAVGNLHTSKAEGIKVYNAKVRSTHYVGGISGQGYCSISNCAVEKAELIAVTAPLANGKEYDEGDKVGGILGHWGESNAPGYVISGCSVKNVSIKGYRDMGGIVGIAAQYDSVKDCSIAGVTITVDKTRNYKNLTDNASFNARNYIGRYNSWTGTETGNTGTATINY